MNSCNHGKYIVVYTGDYCPVCTMQARLNYLESQNKGLLETIQDYKNYLIFGNKEEIKDE